MIPKMPDEYKAKELKGCGYTKTKPRSWTDKEIAWIKDLKEKGFNNCEIAESVDRTEVSISIKLKRLKKVDNTYNENHKEEKYIINKQFLEIVNPVSILDCYAGVKPFWNGNAKKVITNDINKDFETDYHLEALTLLCSEYIKGNKYDIIDLDPFGSAYDCFDLAIKMAKKGLCITLGEMGQKRWKRLDFIKTHYGIDNLNYTSKDLIEHIKIIGQRNKKDLEVYQVRDWQNISRVWFLIQKYRITEQWEQKENLQKEFKF